MKIRLQSSAAVAPMLVLLLCFALGLLSGVWFSGLDASLSWVRLELGGNDLACEPSLPVFCLAFLNALRFPGFCFCGGFVRHGVVIELGALFFRGFFLGYTVCMLVCSYGQLGFWIALVLVLFHGLLLLPLVFYTACYGMGRSLRHRRRFGRLQEQDAALGILILLSCLAAAFLEQLLVPVLLSLLTAGFS